MSILSCLGGVYYSNLQDEQSDFDEEEIAELGGLPWRSDICDGTDECTGQEVPDEILDDVIYEDSEMAPWKHYNILYVDFCPLTNKK